MSERKRKHNHLNLPELADNLDISRNSLFKIRSGKALGIAIQLT